MNVTNNMFKCQGLSSGYQDSIVIRDIGFEIPQGQVHTILGKNGMGKSTLMKTIIGLIRPVTGRLELAGQDVTDLSTQDLVRRGIAYIPQENAIFQDLSVEDNLRLGMRTDRDLEPGLELIANYFPVIPERRKQKAGTLSGGEQKMLLMSRALVMRPRLILMDEISEGLQPTMVTRLVEVVQQLTSKEGATILMAEQNVHFVNEVSDVVNLIKIGSLHSQQEVFGDTFSETALMEAMRD